MPPKRPAPKREIELDFIRGIAILLVLNYHFAIFSRLLPLAPILRIERFGWAGVDIFFVLSGFLVGGLMLKEWKETGQVDSLRFLKRRAFKIWPGYYLFLLVALILHERPLNSFFWQNLFSIQNYVPSSLAHTWSLAVEEHFYLLLAGVMLLFSVKRWTPFTLLIVCIATALSVEALRAVLILHHRPFFFYTHTRIDALLMGVVLAILRYFYPERFSALQRHWILLLLVVAVGLVTLYRDADDWRLAHQLWHPFLITIVDYASAALLLLLYRPGKKHSRPYRMVAHIGIFSYGIYLWHIAMERPVHFVVAHLHGWAATLTLCFLPYLLAIGVGIVATKAIELPFLRLRERLVPSKIPEPPVPAG
jgi:peptidoglycan/LPS O-acetylase OafA/YrhL